MIYFGLVLSSLTELMERFINIGAFYLSPTRIFLLALAYASYLTYCGSATSPITLGRTARRYALAVAALITLTGLSVMASDDLEYSVKRALNTTSIYVMPLVVYLYLSLSSHKYTSGDLLRKTGKCIVYSGLFVALFGFLQEATGILQLSGEVRSLGPIPYTRINSLYLDGNFLAYFLLFPFWLAAVGGEPLTGIVSRGWRWTIAVLILVAIVLSGSRGGALMVAAALGSHWLYRLANGRRGWVLAVEVPLMVLLPLCLLAYAYLGFEHIVTYVSVADTGNESGFSRVLAWYSGLRLYFDHPWLGVGPGNFVTMDKGNLLPFNYVQPWVALRISTLAGHSNVLETLVESGPFTLAAYFMVQLCVYLALLRASAVNGDRRFAVYRSIFFATVMGNLVISYYFLFFMILIGVLLFSMDRDVFSRSALAHKEPAWVNRHNVLAGAR